MTREDPIVTEIREQKRRDLISGLLGITVGQSEDHGYLYQTDAEFHAQINALADLLPTMVEGLAARSRRTSVEREREIRLIMDSPPLMNLSESIFAQVFPEGQR